MIAGGTRVKRTWVRSMRFRAFEGAVCRYIDMPLCRTSDGRTTAGTVIEYDDDDDVPPVELSTALTVLWANVRTGYMGQGASVNDERELELGMLGVTTADGGREIEFASHALTRIKFLLTDVAPPIALCDGLVHLWRAVRKDRPPLPSWLGDRGRR